MTPTGLEAWTEEHISVALEEGWNVETVGGRPRIVRSAGATRFTTDEEAVKHVSLMAAFGGEPYGLAVALHYSQPTSH